MVAEIHVDDYMDYLTIDGLTKISGVEKEYHIALAVKELVDSALDSAGECFLEKKGSNGLCVKDTGPGIPGTDEEIAYLFSINRKTYSTKGDRYPRRGYMGRGLRFVSGVVFCHSATFKLSTRGRTLLLKPTERGTQFELIEEDNDSVEGTTICLEFPQPLPSNALEWGNLAINLRKGPDYKYFSSPFWYDSASFYVLLKSLSLKQKRIIDVLRSTFGGRYRLGVFEERIQSLLKQTKADKITVKDAKVILEKLKEYQKPIKPSRLGYVGKLEEFKYYLKRIGEYEHRIDNGGESETIRIPYVVELWAKLESPLNLDPDKYGQLTVFVNKTPLPLPPIKVGAGNIFNNKIDLLVFFYDGVKSIKLKKHTTFYLNIISPFLPVTSESKIATFPSEINKVLEDLFSKIVKRINREQVGKSYSSSLENRFDTGVNEIKINEIRDKVLSENNRILKKERLTNKRSQYLGILNHDPYMTGESRTKIKQALWFQTIWNRLNPENKLIHLRRLHYIIVSQPEKIIRHNDKPYDNDSPCWNYLLTVSKYARELGLVDPLKIIDRRTPRPYGEFITLFTPGPTIHFMPWALPEINLAFFKVDEFKIPELKIDAQKAYESISALQPVHLEIWTEKATMNDILEDICKKYGVILVQNVGYASITNIEWFLRERAMKTEKPSVILYISDYDEAGENMPVMVSRTLQHRIVNLRKDGLISKAKEICVNPIILTEEQMKSEEFAKLPKAPAKSDNEKSVTELDALEAVMPGKFRQIVEENIEKFLDKDLPMKLSKVIKSEEKAFDEKLRMGVSSQMDQVIEIQKKLKEIEKTYREKLERIQNSLGKKTKPFEGRLFSLRKEIEDYANGLLEELSINITPDKSPPLLNDDLLFVSSRSFKEQTEKLKNYRVFKKRKVFNE